ncbi:MAG: cytochrome P450 [Pseudomonadota bacterium]
MIFNRARATDLSSAAFQSNPLPMVRAMQQRGPLVEERLPIVGKMYFATTQAACASVLKNGADLTVRQGDGSVAGMKWWMPRILDMLARNMLSVDEPDHTRLRRAVDAGFRRRDIMALEPRLHEIADALLIELHKPGEATDFNLFARQFPLLAICELLGLTDERRYGFIAAADAMTRVSSALDIIRMIPALRKLRALCADEIDAQRRQPRDGLIGELVNAERDERLSDDELIAMVFLLFMAGHETTSNTLAGGLFELMRHPDQMEALRNGADMNMAVEEVLRYVSAVQMTKPRYAQRDVEVEGEVLPKGSQVMALLVGANFDPAVIESPEIFDITRTPNRHLSFGSGAHFCLGLMLARLELRVALRAILDRYQSVQLAIPEADVKWRKRLGVRSLEALPLTMR